MTTPNETPQASPTTCIVGCKLPHGLTMELKAKDGTVHRFTVKGMNDARIVGGYGLTPGIPVDFMEAWLKQNEKLPMVRNGLVFMHNDGRSAEARAKEFREVKTGLEAIDPLKDSRAKGIEMDPKAVAAYRKQVASNPMRDRQVVVE